jgi:hypothetical protein|tara:strand:- start:103 stop:372 length:270 start_codon:yes stop_codon:yes gene_type:complete
VTDKTKEDYMIDYIKSFATIEECMVPYKEQRKDLRKNYVDNGWLEKADLKTAVRAYRLMKQCVDFEELKLVYKTLNSSKQITNNLPEME